VIIPDPVVSKISDYLLMRSQSFVASDPRFAGGNGGTLAPRIVQLAPKCAAATI
jgi:hypothetical protein